MVVKTSAVLSLAYEIEYPVKVDRRFIEKMAMKKK